MQDSLTELTLADVFSPKSHALALVNQYRHERFQRICRNVIGTSILETNSSHALIIHCSEDQLEKILNRMTELRLVSWYVCAALTIQIKCAGKVIFESATDLESSTNSTDWNTLESANLISESVDMVATLEKAPAIPQQTTDQNNAVDSDFVSLDAVARATGEDPAKLFDRIMRQGGHNFAIPANKAKALIADWHAQKAEQDFQALLGNKAGGSGSYEELEMIAAPAAKAENGSGSGGSGGGAARSKQRSSLQMAKGFKPPTSLSANSARSALEKALPASARPRRDYLLEITEQTAIGKAFLDQIAGKVKEASKQKALGFLLDAAQSLVNPPASGGGSGDGDKEAAVAN